MVDKNANIDPDPEFRKLYPHLSDKDLIAAQKNFDDYLDVVWRIYQRIKNDPTEYAKFKTLMETSKTGTPEPGQPTLWD